ncbi:CHASE2 domain-containing protein [Acaryochloris sp. IP29b_bin.137]|uniref:CHASE2 domain-containing protein n=1 Tax=Acaryochloris sp. IP29b_bin.137 TaxID=2969217 RepID=UPI00261221D2|nr:CHASE2 domain-containing protein [Acaryochloris sp. IP29b_bin.137]
MDKLVVLRVGEGHFTQGFSVIFQVGLEGDRPSAETNGSLPAAPDIPEHYQAWLTAYLNLGLTTRLEAPKQQITNVAWKELRSQCEQAAETLQIRLNQWLLAESFRPVRDKWLEQLSPDDQIRIILQTDNRQLQRLPWHQWELLNRYAKCEIVLGAPIYEGIQHPSTAKSEINILAILGNSHGINTQADQDVLDKLPDANVQFLVEPQRLELTDHLWEQPWDILFFAGHSHSSQPCDTGHIYLNANEALDIHQLKYSLQRAINKGLKLAIFNSCDGLGLAHQLADLQLPAMVIMREPVPDQVAQYFLKYFLASFSQEQPFHLAVREARERLHDLEPHFPCATWLPIIYQNPAEVSLTWERLKLGDRGRYASWRHSNGLASQIVTIVFTDLANSTAIKQAMPGRDVTTRNQQYFDKILQPHRQRVISSLAAFGGRMVKSEGDGFLMSFPEAMQAVQWSMALQKLHDSDPIETPFGPLQIRIGMHTGSPLISGDDHDFIGQEVDYAYRISDLANGGQILLSEVSAVLLRNAGLTDVAIHTHPAHPLKGIGTVPIFEILWDNHPPHSLRSDGPTHASRPADNGIPVPPPPAPEPDTETATSLSFPAKMVRLCRQPIKAILPISLLLTAALMGLRGVGALQPLELWAFDRLLRLRPIEGPDPRLLVVLVKDEDIQAQGEQSRRSSLADSTLTQLLTKLKEAKPKAIGLDIYRDFAVDPEYPQLAQQLRQEQRLVVPCKGSDTISDPVGIAPPPEVAAANRIGFTDFVEDGDGILRRHLLHMRHEPTSPCMATFSFASLLSFHYLENKPKENKSNHALSLDLTEPDGQPLQLSVQQAVAGRSHRTLFKKIQSLGAYHGMPSHRMAGLQIMLNYRALNHPKDIAETVTVGQVLKGQVHPQAIQDKVVLVGVESSASGDFWSTPYGAGPTYKIAGVFVQAHMVSQIISTVDDQRPSLVMWPQWAAPLWIWCWAIAGGGVAIVFGLTPRSGVATVIAISSLTGISLWGLIQGTLIPFVPALIAYGLATVVVLLVRTRDLDQHPPTP